MSYEYPLLKRVRSLYRAGDNVAYTKLYSCMHLLAPQLEMYKYFIDFGFRPENITVLGKSYSSNVSVIEDLKSLDMKVIQPNFSKEAFDEQHMQACLEIAKGVNDKEVNVVLDDGGFLINAVKDKNILFGVEQTSSGFHKVSELNITFPVFNVARSKTKLTQESPFIARQVAERIEEYLEQKELIRPRILVVGKGPIGEAIQQVFETKGFEIDSCDIETSEDSLVKYMLKEKPCVVVGATGKSILSKESIKKLIGTHRYYLFSASSSDREFPVADFRNSEGVHEDVSYKNIVFVNNGFPITFYGNRNELTPIEIEKTIGLLMGSIMAGIEDVPSGEGLVPVPESLEDTINL